MSVSAQDLLDKIDKALLISSQAASKTYTVDIASQALEALAQTSDNVTSLFSQAVEKIQSFDFTGAGAWIVPAILAPLATDSTYLRDQKNQIVQSGVAPSGQQMYGWTQVALTDARARLAQLIEVEKSWYFKIFSALGNALQVVADTLDAFMKLLKRLLLLTTTLIYLGIAVAVGVGGYIVYQVAKPKVGQLVASGRRRLKAA